MTLLSTSDTPIKRRRFTAEFKARIVANCQQPGASVARIALDHGLNANLVHKWIRAARQQDATSTSPTFLPIALPAQPHQPQAAGSGESIRIEIPRAGGSLVVNWPLSDGDRCLRWLQDLLR
ncbi:transposase [Marinobacterium nitratireducens]|uniref:Transposase n=1 Tax=Marinobacterium nitratireducens TaxID=518897 RepID=A0A917ZIN4_9GAMM|nr:transposase [Marinobacterium nitratireducens]GGO83815.1 transposase [Marinobacterium nitratireducens]